MLSGFMSIADFTLFTLNVDDQLESIFLEVYFYTTSILLWTKCHSETSDTVSLILLVIYP